MSHIDTSPSGITQFLEYNALNNKIRDAIPSKLENSLKLSLPRIASCGSQSSGKSSILTQMTGIRFPRDAGTCTRVPIELRLEAREEEYKAEFHVKWSKEDEWNEEGCNCADDIVNEVNECLASDITDDVSLMKEIEAAIRKVQDAIISVSEKKFSASVITITAFSPNLPNLTLIDLPGIIAHIEGDSSGGALVEDLCKPYLEDSSTVLMAVLDGGNDYENQPIWNMINKYDPRHERTIGVITKADLIAEGTERRWLDLVAGVNLHMALNHGWYVTKSVRQADLQNTSQCEALEQEKQYFSEGFWRDFSHRSHLGTENLRTKMTNLLLERMRVTLPRLEEKVKNMLHTNKETLKSLGDNLVTEKEQMSWLMEKTNELVADLHIQFGHIPFFQDHERKNTFYADVQKMWEKFKYSIQQAGPGHNDYALTKLWTTLPKSAVGIGVQLENADSVDPADVYAVLDSGRRIMCSYKKPSQKMNEQLAVFYFFVPTFAIKDPELIKIISPNNLKILHRYYITEEPSMAYREKVKNRLSYESENRRLMLGERSTDVTSSLCNDFIAKWIEPSRHLVDTMHQQEVELVNNLTTDRFKQFPVLQNAVRYHAKKYLDDLKKDLWKNIKSMHDGEMKIKHTLNDHYFFETKLRYNVQEPTDEQMLWKARELTGNQNLNNLTDAFRKHLLAVGLEPENPFEKHIDDTIATVVAYHKCAYKRYVEYCHISSSKVFFDDFLDKMKVLWNDLPCDTTLGTLFSEERDQLIERKNAVESIKALKNVLDVLKETVLLY